ncbi:MAG: type II/IV secretion system protein [Kiritimatiellae bacterium]|nr:type II/IV secretion system protein [Kiritimatiellia bacterium]
MNNPSHNPESSASLRALAEAFGLLFVETVPDTCFSPELSGPLPVAWAREEGLLPVVIDGVPSLLTSDPANLEAHQKAALAVGCPLQTVVAPAGAIAEAIERCYAAAGTTASQDAAFDRDDALSSRDGGRDGTRPSQSDGRDKEGASIARAPSPAPASGTASDILVSSESTPVIRLVNTMLLDAIHQRASDIHLEPFADHLAIRYRIDGVLYSRPSQPRDKAAAIVSRLKVMADMDIAERRLPQDGMTQVTAGGRLVDIRVSTVPVADGERVVLRLLNRSDTLRPLSSLGMDTALLDDFRSLLKAPNGIIVVSGPTGSGKTTTLYAALGEIDSAHRNVLTIEDPVEYRLPNIGQIQVKPKIGLTFANGLRHILRQDPDVILVGETRDAETAEIAVRASLTGHLVFTTLHTNDAPSAVMRLVDMGVQPYLLASCLRGVLGQRLVRTLCDHCKELVDFDTAADGLDLPANWVEKAGEAEFFTPVGCDSCLDGFSGRTGIFELMVCTPELQSAIRNGCQSGDDLREAAIAAGMHQLADDALERVLEGVTALSEVAGALRS